MSSPVRASSARTARATRSATSEGAVGGGGDQGVHAGEGRRIRQTPASIAHTSCIDRGMSTTTPARSPWCGPLDDPAAATARLLRVAREHDTQAATARALGVSLRTWQRWWAMLGELVPPDELPRRTAGGTAERQALGHSRRRTRRAALRGSRAG